jgi:hypothetical protein
LRSDQSNYVPHDDSNNHEDEERDEGFYHVSLRSARMTDKQFGLTLLGLTILGALLLGWLMLGLGVVPY